MCICMCYNAALAAIYHFIASEDPETIDMLNKMLIIIDPMMNPKE